MKSNTIERSPDVESDNSLTPQSGECREAYRHQTVSWAVPDPSWNYKAYIDHNPDFPGRPTGVKLIRKINGFVSADQIAIQAVCGDRVVRLDSRWNTMVDSMWGGHMLTPAYIESATITHYVTPFKPWNLGRFFIPRPLVERWGTYRIRTSLKGDWVRDAIFLAAQIKALLNKFVLSIFKYFI